MAIASRVIQSPRALRNRLRITIELQVTLTVCEHRDKYNATPPCLTCHHTIVVNHAPQTRAAIRIWQAATNTSCVSAVRENQILSCAHYAVIRPSTSTACESDVALNVLMTHAGDFEELEDFELRGSLKGDLRRVRHSQNSTATHAVFAVSRLHPDC